MSDLGIYSAKKTRNHIDYQEYSFERYRRTVLFERDRAEGKIIIAPRLASALGQ
ncbi:MAG: hypothetical protein AAFU82_04120 [Pseudomonadota bacterium]